MPNKYPNKKGWNVPKQTFKVSNWSEYSQAYASVVTSLFGYLKMPSLNGMKLTGFMMGLVHQGFTRISLLPFAMKSDWFISYHYGNARDLLSPCLR